MKVSKVVDGTDGLGGVWFVEEDVAGSKTRKVGDVDITHLPSGVRLIKYMRLDVRVFEIDTLDGTEEVWEERFYGYVTQADGRSDDQLVEDLVFTGGKTTVPSFRPAR